MWYIFRVMDLRRFLRSKFGNPDFEGSLTRNDLLAKGWTGIIAFDVPGFASATGHFTLWDGRTCADNCYFAGARSVAFWKLR